MERDFLKTSGRRNWRLKTFLLFFLVLVPSGISSAEPRDNFIVVPKQSNSHERPLAAIYPGLVDQTTGFEPDTVVVKIDNYGKRLEATVLTEVAEAITLKTWPGLVMASSNKKVEEDYIDLPETWIKSATDPTVKSEKKGQRPSPIGKAKFESRIILTVPNDQTDEWFALHIGLLPKSVSISPDYAVCNSQVNGCVVRFTRKSMPTPTSIVLKEAYGDKAARVVVGFSEKIQIADKTIPIAIVKDAAAQVVPCVPLDYPLGARLSLIVLLCQANTDLTKVHSVVVGGRESTMVSMAKTSSSSGKVEIPINTANLNRCGVGCQAGRLPVEQLLGL